jgi:hypothetical protein
MIDVGLLIDGLTIDASLAASAGKSECPASAGPVLFVVGLKGGRPIANPQSIINDAFVKSSIRDHFFS